MKKRNQQTFPSIPVKLWKFALIFDYEDGGPLFDITFRKMNNKTTHFHTMVLARQLYGPIYWLKEYYMEVLNESKSKKI
jgi:hypothetical protein